MRNSLLVLLVLIAAVGFIADHSAFTPVASPLASRNSSPALSPIPSAIQPRGIPSPIRSNGEPVSPPPAVESESITAQSSPPKAAQDDIRQAEAAAIKLYPDLTVPGSPLNRQYVAEYHHLRAANPDFFADSAWPLVLARQAFGAMAVRSTAHGAFWDVSVINVGNAKEIARDYETYGDSLPANDDTTASSGEGGWIRNIHFAHQTVLEIKFRTLGVDPSPGFYTLEWFFVAKNAYGQERRIWDGGLKPLRPWSLNYAVSNLLHESRINESQYTFENVPISGTESILSVDSIHTTGRVGYKTEGWVVRLRVAGSEEPLRVWTSLQELDSYATANQRQFDQAAKFFAGNAEFHSFNLKRLGGNP